MAVKGRKPLEMDREALVFLHQPKTAGRSFGAVIRRNIPEELICPHNSWNLLLENRHDLDRYVYFRGHIYYEVGQLIPRPKRYVTMLRHPVERLVSEYRFIRREEGHGRHELVKEMSFEEFLLHPGHLEVYVRFLTYRPRVVEGGKKSFREMVPPGDVKNSVKVAKARLEKFWFVGIMEDFDDSVASLCFSLGWPEPAKTPRRNVAPSSEDQVPVTEREREIIVEKGSADLEIYEYARRLYKDRFLMSDGRAEQNEKK